VGALHPQPHPHFRWTTLSCSTHPPEEASRPLLPGKTPGMGSSCSLFRRCLSSEGLSPESPPLFPQPSLSFL
jgi:hypothetical protein